jgi:hypothetical protein
MNIKLLGLVPVGIAVLLAVGIILCTFNTMRGLTGWGEGRLGAAS